MSKRHPTTRDGAVIDRTRGDKDLGDLLVATINAAHAAIDDAPLGSKMSLAQDAAGIIERLRNSGVRWTRPEPQSTPGPGGAVIDQAFLDKLAALGLPRP